MGKKDRTDGSQGGPLDGLVKAVGYWSTQWSRIDAALRKARGSTPKESSTSVDPFAVKQLVSEIRKTPELRSSVGDELLAAVEVWGQHEAQAAIASFDQKLRDRCHDNSIIVEGRFPDYILAGFLPIRVNVEKESCDIGGHKHDSMAVFVLWPEIQSLITEEQVRQTDPRAFLELLQRAYLRALLLRGEGKGSPVPIKLVFREVVVLLQPETFWRSPGKHAVVEYREELFARDLARLVKGACYVAKDAARLELRPTSFAKDAVALNVDGATRFVGSIAFGEAR